jgi:hypothetical protein
LFPLGFVIVPQRGCLLLDEGKIKQGDKNAQEILANVTGFVLKL